MSAGRAATAAKSAANQARRYEKYTVQPTGFYAMINKFLAVDWKRSTGIPMNPQFRNPPPGSVDPNLYDDPVTVPAADLAENPYWKRDVRRRYPKLSTVTQGDVVALLSVGSKDRPREDVLQIGEEGKKQLVQVKEEGEKEGLAVFLAKEKGVVASVLGEDGLPPRPPTAVGAKPYSLIKDSEQTYGPDYPCRTWH